jgi:hypothetical protein
MAHTLDLTAIPSSPLRLEGIGEGHRPRAATRFKVPLVDTGGRAITVTACGVDVIMSPLAGGDVALMRETFPEVPAGGLVSTSGEVSLLMGQENLCLFPTERRRVGNAALYMSRFGTGWIALGKPPRARSGGNIQHVGVCVIKATDPETTDRLEPQEEDTAICAVSTVSQRWTAPPLHVEGGIFQPYDFLTTESLRTDLPRRCTSCRKCKECKFRTDCLTFKEDQEYQIILEGLEFNKERRRWRATYPFHIPPNTLKDNYGQVFKYTLAQEKRLAKQGRTEEFNAEFYKTVERGVFREITKEEMAAWDGPVNYISMVEAFKEGSHSTTPLRICMNSSLKQPYPVLLSLNDCLIKGPSALVDLFTVTLCIREHRYALAKDLSKFYQRVDADPIAQNLRRVMWSGGDTSAEMKVYITTTVNFGDKPAGCIAIAAAREPAAMDEGEFREAAWFLQNRTYVDDARAGADSMERLEALSGEMEAVAKRGGFEFKETLMSGDKEDENGEPHKVLGLIWETEADRLRVDVKRNLGAKKAGLHLMENIELGKEPEKALPEVITKRERGGWHKVNMIRWDCCVPLPSTSRS